jgi:predicted membrane-bound spermidine synthase
MTALAFFLSGLAALVYQVTWQRILALHSGVGIYSVAVIVAAFMLGLGAGSQAGGVASARLAPAAALRAFAFIELGIGAFGALSVTLYYDLLYVHAAWLYAPLWRAAILHVLALAAPTFLMGMSLPFLVRAMVRSAPTAGATVGRLYAVNLVGAAVGAALTPWVLIRVSGMRGAALCAAAANVAAALLALASRTEEADAGTRSRRRPRPANRSRCSRGPCSTPSAGSARCPSRCCGSASPTSP